MRIVYVLTSLGMGGAERLVLALASRMAERGHTLTVLVLRPPVAEQWAAAVPVVHLNMRRGPISFLIGLTHARRFLIEYRPDLVHSHTFQANIAARLLKVVLPSSVVLSTVHKVYEGGWLRMLRYRLTDGLSRQTTAVSQAAADRFIRLKAVSQRKCLVLTNGIDTAEFAPDSDRRSRIRAAMSVMSEFVWLTAGRIVPAKDIPNLLRAFAQVRAACSSAELWTAGEWPDESLKQSSGPVACFVAGNALPDGVRVLGLRRDLPALLDAADGFVLASAWEGMPLALGEAMAREKAVAATDVGGVHELMGEAGVMAPPRDSNALAVVMLDVMQRKAEERPTIGCSARERIKKRFSMDIKSNEWEALYGAILAAHP